MFFWHVPAPNEALLISGSKRRRDNAQFRVVTGHGSFVLPIKQKARKLSLSLREAEIVEDCVTNQGIRLSVRAVAAFKVGDDDASIANAARRFLSEQSRMEELVGRIFSGHLRSIIGGLTVEQIIRERDRVAQEVKEGSHSEMEKLGIVVDALQIQEIVDKSGYIDNLAAPHAANVASQARIAAAQADQVAAEREQEAAALKAQYERDLQIKRAGFAAETEDARARAAQAGPLAEAHASQEVIQQQTVLAQRQAELAAQRLEAEVRRPADAEAYRKRALAEAQRDQAKHEADGAAYAIRVNAEAEAEANRVRAESLRDGNQEVLAANQLIATLPEIVEAAARGIASSNLTILNGAEGVSQMIAGIVSQGKSILDALHIATVPGIAGNPAAPAAPIEPAEPAEPIAAKPDPASNGHALQGPDTPPHTPRQRRTRDS
jgi:uncharacterized membrane protein YqiK